MNRATAAYGLRDTQGCAFPLEKAALAPGETVLDLGCGAGVEAMEAARRVGQDGTVFGLDRDAEALALARGRAATEGVQNIQFLEGRLERIPLENACVDAVISNCAINLCSDRAAALAEVSRVLKPGGRLVIADIAFLGTAVSTEAQQLIAPVLGCTNGVLTQEEYLQLLAECVFENIELEVFLRFSLDRIKSRAEKRAATAALEALTNPDLARSVHGTFASVYLLARKAE